MIDIKLEGMKEAIQNFDSQKVITAARQAINRTADSTRTEASRLIRQEYNVTASKLNEFLKVEARANGSRLTARITGRARGFARSYFDPKQEGVMVKTLGIRSSTFKSLVMKKGRRYGGDVTTIIKLSEGRKIVPGKYGNKPFIAQTNTGHIGVWVRKGKARTPIEQLWGPGIATLFGSMHIMKAIRQFVCDKFRSEFDRLLSVGPSGAND